MPNEDLYTAVWLLLHDKEFAEAHSQLDPRIFPRGALRYLADLALRYWPEYRQPMTDASLGRCLQEDSRLLRRHATDVETVAQVYIDLDEAYGVVEEDLPLARKQVAEWLDRTWVRQAVSAAGDALEGGDTEAAREYLDTVKAPLIEEEEEVVLEEEANALLQRPVQDWETGITTGLKEIDDLWGGGIHPGELGIVIAPTNVGKAVHVDTLIPTPRGWTTMGELQVGDQVFDELGKPCQVVATSPVWQNRPCYRLVFADGAAVDADADHEWLVETSFSSWENIQTTRQLYRRLNDHKKPKIYVPVAAPLNLPELKLPIDPYVLGVWLGDGTAADGSITIADQDILEELDRRGYPPHPLKAKYRYYTYGFMAQLRSLGVLNNKHIPAVYLRSSIEQRLDLLQGLMDTDGTAALANGYCEIALKDGVLPYQVVELIQSLGMKCYVRRNKSHFQGREYQDRIRMHFHARLPVFRLKRKLERLPTGYIKRHSRRHIKSITPISPSPTKCVQVDSSSSLFLIGREMIPTHNSMVLCSFVSEAYWKGKDTLYYTFELSTEQITQRIMAGIVRQGPVTTEGKDWDDLLNQAAKLRHWRGDLPSSSIIVRSDSLTLRDLIARLERYESKRGKMPDLLILDSADDLVGGEEHERDWERLKRLYTSIRRDVCQEMGIPVWTSGQATKEAVDRARISLRHAGDAFAKYQRAHLTLGLAQTTAEAQEGFDGDPFGGSLLRVYVLKDTLHGTRGVSLSCRAMFGRGQDGWPQLEVEEGFNMPPVSPRRNAK